MDVPNKTARSRKMKCVAVGDIFITVEMMQDAVEHYGDMITDAQYFYFGSNTKKSMRDTVKKIERRELDSIALPAGLADALADAEMIMVHLCPVTAELLKHAPKLKYILCNRGGVENIDVEAATAAGIMVMNNPAHNANAVAEFTIGLMFVEMRNITRANIALKEGNWREKFPNSERIIELKNLTVGIVGFGSVGELVCEKLSGFGCRILVYNPSVKEKTNPRINWDKVEFVDFDQLVTKSDIVSLHARANKVIFGQREFEMMKPHAYFINTARSCMVDNNALYNALREEQIRGAAIDVFEVEPIGPAYPFLALDNVTLTNHRGGDTINSYSDSPDAMFEALKNYLEQGISPRYWYNRNKR